MPANNTLDVYPGLESPAVGAEEVTPSDSVDLTNVSRALWVGSEGNLSVVMLDGQTVTFINMTIGWHPMRVTRVRATGTTASGVVSVW